MLVTFSMKTYVILHNIRSAHNVGSIFRTADGAGVSKIFLVGYTPAPIDRFGREQEEIVKTSLGASLSVPWEQFSILDEVVSRLREEGVMIIAVEQHTRSVDYRSFPLKNDRAFIFGNEIEGVPSSICDQADAVVEIPMNGMKESLNVSVAAGIILFNTL